MGAQRDTSYVCHEVTAGVAEHDRRLAAKLTVAQMERAVEAPLGTPRGDVLGALLLHAEHDGANGLDLNPRKPGKDRAYGG